MNTEPNNHSRTRLAGLSLAALGVVYGDIGTSPLYAIKECFDVKHGVPISASNILGVLSLVLWALTLVVSIKYLCFVLRAGNKGEGGILALMSLAFPERRTAGRNSRVAAAFAVAGR